MKISSISNDIAMAKYTSTGAEKIDDKTAVYRNISSKVKAINNSAKKVHEDVTEQGISGITNLFAVGDTLTEKLNLNPDNEYLKRMLITQMDLDGMLLTHKYFNTGFDAIPIFRKEAEKIRRYTETDSILQFDNNTMEALFGNSLGITSEDEYEEWKEFAYNNRYKGKNLDLIYFEEEFKHNYENEQNSIKKFIQSFKYRKLFKQDTLEDSYTKKVREVMRENIIANTDNTFVAHQECSNMLQRGVAEYGSLQELEGIAKMTLTSLQQPQNVPINIADTCKMFRTEIQNSNLPKMGIDYRQKQVTLGSETGIKKGPVVQTVPFEEVPNAIGDLQQEYKNLYDNAQSQEDYIRGISKIYADFIYIQPYEDGNKRTATCLLNSMFLSNGILPPPISLVNDEQMIEAFNKAKDKDYTMLQDIIVNKYRKTKSTFEESNNAELTREDVVKKSPDILEM